MGNNTSTYHEGGRTLVVRKKSPRKHERPLLDMCNGFGVMWLVDKSANDWIRYEGPIVDGQPCGTGSLTMETPFYKASLVNGTFTKGKVSGKFRLTPHDFDDSESYYVEPDKAVNLIDPFVNPIKATVTPIESDLWRYEGDWHPVSHFCGIGSFEVKTGESTVRANGMYVHGNAMISSVEAK